MKKQLVYIITVFFFLTVIPSQLKADALNANSAAANTARERAEAKVLLNRLEVIKEMSKSQLSSVQKKELRKEVRSIREQMKKHSDGIYLSIGAAIIILLLLILIL
jgi:hypothetical protein